MENRICPECSTANEPKYVYCKNCGCKLASEEYQPPPPPPTNNTNYSNFTHQPQSDAPYDNFAGRRPENTPPASNPNFSSAPKGFILDSIDGNSTDEVSAFVGKKAPEILPKFSKMELSGSKISWCWPPAVLGFLFGPLGSAIWFFYRRMYKIALILVAIGIITGGTVAFLNRDTLLLDESQLETIIEQNMTESSIDFFGLIDDIGSNIGTESYIASALTDIVDTATGILAGMFALYFYKRFVAEKIVGYRQCGIDPRYYTMGLASVGGTSGGMLALGIAILYIAQTVFDLIPNLI